MRFLRPIIMVAGLVLIWQLIIITWQLPPYILPSPWLVAKALHQYAGVIWQQAQITMAETLLGLLLGTLFGCGSALLLILFRPLKLWFLPILLISQAIPTFAIAPLLVVWLGYGMASKIATAIIMIFFPVASAFFDGLGNTNSHWLDMAKTMNATRWQLLWRIRVPAALPSLASGLRVAAAIAPIGAIVGEWVGASQGLGYLMLNANARMQIDMMFAALIVLVIFALLLYYGVDKMLRYLITW